MYHTEIIANLSRNKAIFEAHFRGISSIQYLWKPSPEKWCLLEILCHLVDEEIEDFRARVGYVLEQPETPMPSIDPVGWVTSRKYMEANYEERLSTFLEERQKSIDWLNSLNSPKWENKYHHPTLGEMTAQKFLANWLAHDYLHLRQIGKIKYLYLKNLSDEDLTYAGNW